MAAAKKGRTDVCEWLLKKGADRNFTDVQGIKEKTSLPVPHYPADIK